MADMFVSSVIEKLINTCYEYLEDQSGWQKNMKEELERLRENQPNIQAVAVYASNQELMGDQNSALNKWLWQLRDAIDEADDVLDEIEYMKCGGQPSKNKKQRNEHSTMKFIYKRLVKIRKRALNIKSNLKRLELVVQKLNKISICAYTFIHLVKDAEQENQGQQLELYTVRGTGSFPTPDLIGRGKEKEFIMKWLSRTSNEPQATRYNNISLLSIVGLGGIGKTTLLQYVYENVKTEEFDLKMWVCVSNKFNAQRVIVEMLECLDIERSCLETLEALQKNLQYAVTFQRFLLVLDDIWDDDKVQDKIKWENVLAPLASGKLGSKILVATQMESIASMFSDVMNKSNEIFRLNGLNDGDCLLLLRHAFHGTEENPEVHHNLRSIAENMIKKLSGSPLAARVIGSLLKSSLEGTHWTKVLNYDFESHNGIPFGLKLCYTFLPKILQKCLSFCCTFPQNYEFYKDDLIQMWIALDFIQRPKNQRETLKDVGESYIDILVRKSLFNKFKKSRRTYYKVHDLLHKIVRVISAPQYFSIVDDEQLASETPENIRYLFVKTAKQDVLQNMEKFKKLRSLCLSYNNLDDADDCFDILTKTFKALRSIRLLVMHVSRLERIPEEIGHLIHLRCFKICIRDTSNQLLRPPSNLYRLRLFYGKFSIRHALVIHAVGKLEHLRMLEECQRCFECKTGE